MHYRAKDVPRAGFVADADALMREFVRAEGAIHDLDQNNLKDDGIANTKAIGPGSDSGITLMQTDASAVPIYDPNSGTSEAHTRTAAAVDGSEWIPVYDGAGTQTVAKITFQVPTTMLVHVIAQVEFSVALGASGAFHNLGIRAVVDGTPGDVVDRVPFVQDAANTVLQSCFVEDLFLLQPGEHEAWIEGRDMRNNDAQIANTVRRTLIVFGFLR